MTAGKGAYLRFWNRLSLWRSRLADAYWERRLGAPEPLHPVREIRLLGKLDAALAERRKGPWLVELTCCGRDAGNVLCRSWDEADASREAYTSGPGARPYGRPDLWGHERSGVVRRLPDVS